MSSESSSSAVVDRCDKGMEVILSNNKNGIIRVGDEVVLTEDYLKTRRLLPSHNPFEVSAFLVGVKDEPVLIKSVSKNTYCCVLSGSGSIVSVQPKFRDIKPGAWFTSGDSVLFEVVEVTPDVVNFRSVLGGTAGSTPVMPKTKKIPVCTSYSVSSICPSCKSTDTKSTGEGGTEVFYCPLKDKEGNEHDHDGNRDTESLVCKSCKNEWSVVVPHTCWCGWIQGRDELGSQEFPLYRED